ncbi:hypothetical protein [Rhodovibrio salinarum]|uniref:hypothetical protein n=1 Tax=Rhodovibrio salinarum TaxID=1087 RepID=UPI000489C646|nr:hypothetical protein [Rhodovibrio salinarum]
MNVAVGAGPGLGSARRQPFRDRGEDTLLKPEAIAESYWQPHLQPRSAWTHECDLRPWVEPF